MDDGKGNRWRILVELTWDVTEDDLREQYYGDTEADFGNRALRRVRVHLMMLLAKASLMAIISQLALRGC